MFKRIVGMLSRKPKAFVVHDSVEGMTSGINKVKSLNIDVEGYTDYSDLLYILNKCKDPQNRYDYGLIYENGSKYKPQILCNILRSYNPNIKLVIFKNEMELHQKTSSLLT